MEAIKKTYSEMLNVHFKKTCSATSKQIKIINAQMSNTYVMVYTLFIKSRFDHINSICINLRNFMTHNFSGDTG